MSHFRIEISTISKANGQSAEAAFKYDDRVKHVDKSDLVSRGSVNMPEWVKPDTKAFWRAADTFERANAMVARRAIISFPNQLPSNEREGYIKEWLVQNCPDMPASWAIHDDPSADPANPHAHVLISERLNDGIERAAELFFKRFNAKEPHKGGCKKADIGSSRKDWLSTARASWADILNKHLPADQQVSHRSNEARGLPPGQPKFGAAVLAAGKKGIRTKLVSSVFEDAATRNKIRCLSFVNADGKTITYRSGIDKGDSLEIYGKASLSKVIDLVRACQEKGWVEVDLFGTDEFKALARAELAKNSIKIRGEQNEQNRGDDSKSIDRSSEGSGREGTGRPASTGSTVIANSRSNTVGERTKSQADFDVAGSGKPETFSGREADSLDGLCDHRRADISVLASGYNSPNKPVPPELLPNKRGNDMQKYLTQNAVLHQMAAMDEAVEFEAGILNSKNGRMQIQKMKSSEVLASVSLLKRENARGSDIYIRPARESAHPYLLMDDLNNEQMADLKAEGFDFAMTLETSPKNHQCLIKMPFPMMAADRKNCERALQKRFGSDLGSCDGQHFFRLAGFTNRKPKHFKDGLYPHVKLRQHNPSPKLSARALEWMEIAKQQQQILLKEQAKSVELFQEVTELRVEQVITNSKPEWSGKGGDLAAEVAKAHRQLEVHYGQKYDPSIADFDIAKKLLADGWKSESVKDGLRNGLPNLDIRKVGHVENYLDRTIEKITGNSTSKNAEAEKVAEAEKSKNQFFHPSAPRP